MDIRRSSACYSQNSSKPRLVVPPPSLPRLTMPRKDMKLLLGGSPHELSVLTGYYGRIFHQTQNYVWCPRYQPILLVGPPPCTITQDMGVLPKSCHKSEFFIAHTSITDPV